MWLAFAFSAFAVGQAPEAVTTTVTLACNDMVSGYWQSPPKEPDQIVEEVLGPHGELALDRIVIKSVRARRCWPAPAPRRCRGCARL